MGGVERLYMKGMIADFKSPRRGWRLTSQAPANAITLHAWKLEQFFAIDARHQREKKLQLAAFGMFRAAFTDRCFYNIECISSQYMQFYTAAPCTPCHASNAICFPLKRMNGLRIIRQNQAKKYPLSFILYTTLHQQT